MTSKRVQNSAIKALQKELLELNVTPVEGFKVNPSAVENMFIWDVAIFGPPMTLYEGGYFKARLFFPNDYPYSPPSIQFLSKMYHPNIYENGEVCISILHSPGDDPQSEELAAERWNPTQNVRTILLSVISLLNEPNIHSAAHVEASVAYRKWKESHGKDDTYERVVRDLVKQTFTEAEKDGVVVPRTLEEYCISGRPGNDLDYSEFEKNSSDFDDDYEYYAFDVDEDDNESESEEEGTGTNPFNPLVVGADSAMEEAEGEPFVRPKHDMQSIQSLPSPTPCQSRSKSPRSTVSTSGPFHPMNTSYFPKPSSTADSTVESHPQ